MSGGDATVDAGEVIDPSEPRSELPDRYVDLGRIALGGTSQVRRVHDRVLDADLAMKILAWGAIDDPVVRERFVREAQVTARLRHPTVVAVQDLGELEDGRPWYTMTEVRGATFADAEASLVRRIGWLVRVGQGVAYAHEAGVAHLDLKPDNLMVGSFGNVWIMDWGLTPPPAGRSGVFGTPGWLAPEQAGAPGPVGPPSDVWALGALVFWAVTGRPPHPGRTEERLASVLERPTPDLSAVPEELVPVVAATLVADPARRPSASWCVGELESWLLRVERRAEAQVLIDATDALQAEIEADEQRISDSLERARRALAGLHGFDPVDAKIPLWREEDQALAERAAVDAREAERVQLLMQALKHDPSSDAAHARLADHHHRALLRAAERGDEQGAAHHRVQLAHHDRGAYAGYLSGKGTVTLHADPERARVRIERLVVRDRRVVAEPLDLRLTTPVDDLVLDAGDYRVHLAAEGRDPIAVPVRVTSGEAWCPIRPGSTAPHRYVLPVRGETPHGCAWVASGWASVGGDPDAIEAIAGRRVWVDGFFAARDPVTNADYLAFLDAVDDEVARAHLPRTMPTAGSTADPVVAHDGSRWQLLPDPAGHLVAPDLPVTRVTWEDAHAYLDWQSRRGDRTWRLPTGIEWEWAARGPFGWSFPLGPFLEPTWTVMIASRREVPMRRPVDELEADRSPWGLRGMSGNTREWCADPWTYDGGRVERGLHRPDADGDAPYGYEIRGGCFLSSERQCRAASRFAAGRTTRMYNLGFRAISVTTRAR